MPLYLPFAPAVDVAGRLNGSEYLSPLSLQSIPSFCANKGGVGQTGIATGTDTKLTFPNVRFNIGGFYDNTLYRWTPSPGPIVLSLCVQVSGLTDQGVNSATLYKNSALFARGLVGASGTIAAPAITVDDVATGTDFYEAYVNVTTGATATASGSNVQTIFCGWAM